MVCRSSLIAALAVVVSSDPAEGPGAPIRQRGGWLVIENHTKMEWRDVSVTLNAYYRGVAPRVAAGAGSRRRSQDSRPGWAALRYRARARQPRRGPRHGRNRETGALHWDENTDPPLVQEGR